MSFCVRKGFKFNSEKRHIQLQGKRFHKMGVAQGLFSPQLEVAMGHPEAQSRRFEEVGHGHGIGPAAYSQQHGLRRVEQVFLLKV